MDQSEGPGRCPSEGLPGRTDDKGTKTSTIRRVGLTGGETKGRRWYWTGRIQVDEVLREGLPRWMGLVTEETYILVTNCY